MAESWRKCTCIELSYRSVSELNGAIDTELSKCDEGSVFLRSVFNGPWRARNIY